MVSPSSPSKKTKQEKECALSKTFYAFLGGGLWEPLFGGRSARKIIQRMIFSEGRAAALGTKERSPRNT